MPWVKDAIVTVQRRAATIGVDFGAQSPFARLCGARNFGGRCVQSRLRCIHTHSTPRQEAVMHAPFAICCRQVHGSATFFGRGKQLRTEGSVALADAVTLRGT